MSEVSKVQLGDEVLIDLTEDTVTEANLLKGQRAHGADGREIIGALIAHNVIDRLDSYSTEDGLSANQGRILNEKMPTEQTVADWGFTKNEGTYVLPADGIPKDDLSEDVKASLDKAESATTQEWVLNNAKDAYYSKGYYCHYHDMMYGDALFNISEEDYIKLAHYDLPVTITETSGDGSIRVITVDESNFNESTRDITIDAEFGVVINQKDFRLNTVTIYEAIPHEDTVRYWGFAYQDEIPTELSQLNGDSTHRTVTDAEKAKWNAGGGKVPTKLSELEDDATHRLVTDTEKSTWNGKADASEIPTQLSALADDSNHRLVTDAEKTVWDEASTDASDALDQIDILGGDVSDVKESLIQSADWLKSSNLWNEKYVIGSTSNTDGSIISGNYIVGEDLIEVKPSTVYTITVPSACIVYFFDASQHMLEYVNTGTTSKFTTSASTKYIRFRTGSGYGNVYKNDIAIVEGEGGTYQPYSISNTGLTQIVDDAIDNGYIGLNLATISQGGIDQSGEIVSETRCRTGWIAKNSVILNFSSDLEWLAYAYDSNKNFISQSAWLTSKEYKVDSAKYLRFVFRWKNNTSGKITPSDLRNTFITDVPSNTELKQSLSQLTTPTYINSANISRYISAVNPSVVDFVGGNDNFITICGNVVTISLRIRVLQAISASTKIFTIDNSIKPFGFSQSSNGIAFPLVRTWDRTDMAFATISNFFDGIALIGAHPTGDYFGTITYIRA